MGGCILIYFTAGEQPVLIWNFGRLGLSLMKQFNACFKRLSILHRPIFLMSGTTQTSTQTMDMKTRHIRFLSDCKQGLYGKVQQQLSGGTIDVNYADHDSRTALHVSVDNGRGSICRLLIDANAPLEARDRWGKTPFMYSKTDEIRSMLIAHGAIGDPSSNITDEQAEILTYAVDGNIRGVRQCILGGGKNAVRFADYDGRTALHLAACEGTDTHFEIAKLLILNKADVSAVDRNGNTAYSNAKANGHIRFMDLLKYERRRNPAMWVKRILK